MQKGLDILHRVCYLVNAAGERQRKEMIPAARKTTSTEVKRRYNEKVYGRIYLQLPKETVEAFKAKCNSSGVSQASVLLEAIEKFLRG